MRGESKVFRQNPDFVYRNILGENLLIPIARQPQDIPALYTLNELSARIWELLDGTRNLEEVCALLLEEFEVSAEELKPDVHSCIENLKTMRAIEPAGSGRQS